MAELTAFITLLNNLTPLGMMALLGVIILLLVHKRGPLKTLQNNHLEHVQGSLDRIVQSSERQERVLGDIKDGVNWMQGRLDR